MNTQDEQQEPDTNVEGDSQEYDAGFDEGYSTGHDDGYEEGKAAGIREVKEKLQDLLGDL